MPSLTGALRFAGLTLVFLLMASALAGPIPASAQTPARTYLLSIPVTDEASLARLADSGVRLVRLGPGYGLVLATAEEEQMPALRSAGPVRLGEWDPQDLYFLVDTRATGATATPLEEMGAVLLRDAKSAVVRIHPDQMDHLNSQYHTARILDRVLRISQGLARGREEAARSRSVTYDPQIQAMVNAVDQTRLQNRVQDLQNFGTRKSDTAGGTSAQTYLVNQFTAMGYTDVTTYSYNTWCDDVICVKPGTATPDHIYVIGGHYDSTSSTSSAPGADDNASGTVGVLEAAQILFPYDFESTIYFCCWSGEEQGLVGSDAWCTHAVSLGLDIRGYLNLDMEGYLNSTKNVDIVSNSASTWFHDLVFELIPMYVPTLPVVDGHLPVGASSDHASFWDHGYSAVFFFEDSDNYSPYIHTPQDVIGTSLNNFQFMKENTQASIATMATLAVPFQIAIDHTPLVDTQDIVHPYPVVARIIAVAPLMSDSLRMRYRVDSGAFTWLPMLPTGNPDEFSAEIPPALVGSTIDYYIRARDTAGHTETSPEGAPGVLHSFSIPALIETFEQGGGWVANLEGTDNATFGLWIQADPVGTTYNGSVIQPEDDHTAAPGAICWVTGNGSVGGAAGEQDVDGGATTLYSATYDLNGTTTAMVKYWRWWTDKLGVNTGDDTWITQVRNNGGAWQNLENTTTDCNCWVQQSFDLRAMFGANLGLVQLKFIANDSGSNSLLEALIDDFELVSRTTEGAPESIEGPEHFALYPCRPNPTRTGTLIDFRVPAPVSVRMAIFDVAGRCVRSLADRGFDAGRHQILWDGRDASGLPAPSGIYFCKMRSNEWDATGTVVLTR